MDSFVFSLLLHTSRCAYQIFSKHPNDFIGMHKEMSPLYIEHKKEFTLEFQPSLQNVWFSYVLTGLRDSSESGRNLMAHLHINLQ